MKLVERESYILNKKYDHKYTCMDNNYETDHINMYCTVVFCSGNDANASK